MPRREYAIFTGEWATFSHRGPLQYTGWEDGLQDLGNTGFEPVSVIATPTDGDAAGAVAYLKRWRVADQRANPDDDASSVLEAFRRDQLH
jgi:hypothetical protein